MQKEECENIFAGLKDGMKVLLSKETGWLTDVQATGLYHVASTMMVHVLENYIEQPSPGKAGDNDGQDPGSDDDLKHILETDEDRKGGKNGERTGNTNAKQSGFPAAKASEES